MEETENTQGVHDIFVFLLNFTSFCQKLFVCIEVEKCYPVHDVKTVPGLLSANSILKPCLIYE